MKILERLEKIRDDVAADPLANAALGARMQELGCLAVEEGINSRAWEQYMRLFASNPDQLKRLIGKDEEFNQTFWGRKSLAYMVANGCCGIDTNGNTINGMNSGMRATLDSLGLSSVPDPSFVTD